MASKEYKERLKLENPEKYKIIYGSVATSKYRDKLKLSNPEEYKKRRSEYRKGWKAKNPEKHYANKKHESLKRKYGITLDQFNEILSDQGFKCKSCNENLDINKSRHVDHCHKTGKIRGILCLHCNVALGYVKDSIDRLKSLIKYLET